MLDPIPAPPSKPQTAWFYGLASFLLLYSVLLYFYLGHVWTVGGFSSGLGKHAGYFYQGFRGLLLQDRLALWKWHYYTHTL